MAIAPITVQGTDRTYTLQVGTNAFCRLEELTGLTFMEVLEILQTKPRMVLVRQLVMAALVDPPPASLSLEDVGLIVDDIGQSTLLDALHGPTAAAIEVPAAAPSADEAESAVA